MTSIGDEFVSTFRIHYANRLWQTLPSRRVFSDLIDPYLRAGFTVVDPTRLAARLEASRKYTELPFLALRPSWLAAVYLEAGIVLATAAAEHAPFYQRVFGYRVLCAPRDYPLVRFPIVCMALSFPDVRDDVEARYPFFRSTESEREALFAPASRKLVSRASGEQGGIPSVGHDLPPRDVESSALNGIAASEVSLAGSTPP